MYSCNVKQFLDRSVCERDGVLGRIVLCISAKDTTKILSRIFYNSLKTKSMSINMSFFRHNCQQRYYF